MQFNKFKIRIIPCKSKISYKTIYSAKTNKKLFRVRLDFHKILSADKSYEIRYTTIARSIDLFALAYFDNLFIRNLSYGIFLIPIDPYDFYLQFITSLDINEY